MAINKLSGSWKVALLILVSAGFGAGLYHSLINGEPHTPVTTSNNIETATNKEPLYWVAPMDDNYRRDKPGKSPMGMDLVPVYAQSSSDKGVIKISPSVVNNLGVRTEAVSMAKLVKTIEALGIVKYNEDNLVHIHPRVDGWIETLYVNTEGQQVTKGDPIYQLYSPQLVNAQQEFVLALQQQSKKLIQATQQRLLALNISDKTIQNLKRTGQVQQFVTFYAPMDGVVVGLQVRDGFYVKPGTTMMSIAQLDEVWVEADIYERDSERVKLGQFARMTLDYEPGRVWYGMVDFIYPSLDATTRTLKARFNFANKKRLLKPNMFTKVELEIEAEQLSMLVPKSAVIRTGTQDRVVVVLGEGEFKSVAVVLGQEGANVYEILNGIEPSDMVVVSAQFLIDSESSKTSDFMRMQSIESKTAMPDMEMSHD